jgi:outer membrane PBP1 activator LpoA protein
MLNRFCKTGTVLLLATALSAACPGLCAPVQANTTDPAAVAPLPGTAVSPTAPAAPTAPAVNTVPGSTPILQGIPPFSSPKPPPVRIALLLPLRSEALGAAADIVRKGFMAGYEREKEDNLAIAVVETGDAAQDILSGYNAATLTNDIVVGPLSRSAVTAIAQSGAVNKPTIALALPESQNDAEVPVPPKMLVMGLSVEEEARQVADWARESRHGKALVVSAGATWQRRAARAFTLQWKARGQESEQMELVGANGFFNARTLSQLKKQIQTEKPALVFAALDAAQARQLREGVGNEAPIYGTSQLNPFTSGDGQGVERMTEMNGVRLVDMPWQLQPDHTAVMVYPRLVLNPDQKRVPEMERLYALGIDAFRVAREIALNRPGFEIDGVTGRLKGSFGRGAARFQRIEPTAVYRGGVVVPLSAAQ